MKPETVSEKPPVPEQPNPEKKETQKRLFRSLALEEFIREFGLESKDLGTEAIRTLSIARRLEKFIEKFKIPVAVQTGSADEKILTEKEVERVLEKTRYKDAQQASPIPAESMEVATVQNPEELPDVLPTEWVLEEIAPDLFDKKLVQKELLKRQWEGPTKIPEIAQETVIDKELTEVRAPPKEEKQHAFTLLDVSGSMEGVRMTIGSALALAFLRQGHRNRAQLGIRPFNNNVGPASMGKTEKEFSDMARRVLEFNSDGGTDIQTALRVAAADVLQGGEFNRADILLITDGMSDLGSNPLGDIKLHTVLLGNTGYDEKLDTWSSTLQRLEDKDFEEFSDTSAEEIKEIEETVRSLSEEVEKASTEEEKQEFGERINTLTKIVECLQGDSGDYDGRKKIKEALEKLYQYQEEWIKGQSRALPEEIEKATTREDIERFQKRLRNLKKTAENITEKCETSETKEKIEKVLQELKEHDEKGVAKAEKEYERMRQEQEEKEKVEKELQEAHERTGKEVADLKKRLEDVGMRKSGSSKDERSPEAPSEDAPLFSDEESEAGQGGLSGSGNQRSRSTEDLLEQLKKAGMKGRTPNAPSREQSQQSPPLTTWERVRRWIRDFRIIKK